MLLLSFFDTRLHFRDIFWYFEMLRHRPTDLMDGRTDLLPDFIVCLARACLSLDPLSLDLRFCLSRTEEVGCKLLTSHMIEDLLCRLEFLPSMDISRLHTSIEPHISMICEFSIVPDSRLLRSTGEIFIVLGEVFPKLHSPLICEEMLREFLPMRLYSEV